ncbi:hypothetical protein G7046_g9323 [Stylonectria norvegica]|nr:hypothetical protein G7046_g9323 [Stylonectria norvegica]
MASRRPDLKIPIPEREQGELQRPPSSVRSPRFIEDFDAPFSEALMNASRSTLATDRMSHPSTSTHSRNSFGEDSASTLATDRMSHPSTSTHSRNSFGEDSAHPSSHTISPLSSRPSFPLRLQETPWATESKRRSGVNDRIREWARKSWGAVRVGSDRKDGYFDFDTGRRKESVVLGATPSDASPSELRSREISTTYEGLVADVTELPRSRTE